MLPPSLLSGSVPKRTSPQGSRNPGAQCSLASNSLSLKRDNGTRGRQRTDFSTLRWTLAIMVSLLLLSAAWWHVKALEDISSLVEDILNPPADDTMNNDTIIPLRLSSGKTKNGTMMQLRTLVSDTKKKETNMSSSPSKKKNATTILPQSSAKEQTARAPEQLWRHEAHLYAGITGCYVTGKLKYIDCGYDGHVYSADMYCSGDKRRPRRIVLKVTTRPVDGSKDPKAPRMYTSDDLTLRKKEEKLYYQLLGSTTEGFKKHFAIPLGAVNIPHAMLYEGMEQANNDCVDGRYDGIINSTNEAATVVSADILDFVSGKNLGEALRENPSLETRRHIVRELVKMYHHMYDRKVLHCDISCAHIVVSGNQTTLIDFYRHSIETNDPNLAHRQQTQLWQLLSLIGNVCTDTMGHEREMDFSVPVCACNLGRPDELADPSDLMKRLKPALKKCSHGFKWRNVTMDNTEQTYTDLLKWSGTERYN